MAEIIAQNERLLKQKVTIRSTAYEVGKKMIRKREFTLEDLEPKYMIP